MADPLSFVASIVALSTLAGTVVTKGYRYLKAVKDCPEDVRRLMAEVNVLCGILNRLGILLQSRKPAKDVSKDPAAHDSKKMDHLSNEDPASDSSLDSEDEAETCAKDLEVPDFIHECRRTLDEIQDILNRFAHSDGPSSRNSGKTFRFNASTLRRLEPKDLKWPLSASKTMRLVEALERHKSTCTMALAGDGMVGIHAVLKETKLSNKYLAEIRAKQQKILELHVGQEEGESTIFFSFHFGLTA
ncbi:MAG: hypothetical protein Q9208_004733 [Pyrenodesmia sp. 3 TL-2023]